MTKRIDWLLLVTVFLLAGTGMLILHAINFKDISLAQDFDPTRQVVSLLIGTALLIVFAQTDYRLWFRLGYLWYVGGLALLGLVLVIGEVAFGATRAIDIGFLQFQPTEFIKLGVIMVLARLFTKHSEELERLRYLAFSIGYLAVPVALIILQPDLGSAMVVVFIWLVITFTSKVNKFQLVALLVLALALTPLLIGYLQPYQQERIQTFINPANDPSGAGYNVTQATIAVGSGQLLGRGLGSGSQGQLNFLPSQQTDFVFAVLAEKLGFLGAGLVLILFALLLIRAIVIAWRANDQFGMLLASGIVAMFLFHIVINVGMNLGIMPVTGIPLPFISYGGTNLIVSLIAVGLLESIAIHTKELRFRH